MQKQKEDKMEKNFKKIALLDIYHASYLALHGFTPELTLQGTRVVFEFQAANEVYKLTREYNTNPSVPILDYINNLRRLKAMMFSMKGGI